MFWARFVVVLRDPVDRYHSFNRMKREYEELESTLQVGNLSAFRSYAAACEDAVLATQAKADTGKFRIAVECRDKNLVRSMYGYWLRRWAIVHEAAGERGRVRVSRMYETNARRTPPIGNTPCF